MVPGGDGADLFEFVVGNRLGGDDRGADEVPVGEQFGGEWLPDVDVVGQGAFEVAEVEAVLEHVVGATVELG